jgi:hypothetical protein
MLASVYRNTAAKSLKSLVPKVGGTSAVSSHNLVARRFKSDDAGEQEESRQRKTNNNNDSFMALRSKGSHEVLHGHLHWNEKPAILHLSGYA